MSRSNERWCSMCPQEKKNKTRRLLTILLLQTRQLIAELFCTREYGAMNGSNIFSPNELLLTFFFFFKTFDPLTLFSYSVQLLHDKLSLGRYIYSTKNPKHFTWQKKLIGCRKTSRDVTKNLVYEIVRKKMINDFSISESEGKCLVDCKRKCMNLWIGT